jgi:hypothetical protein
MPGPPHAGGTGSIGKVIALAVVVFVVWSVFRTIRSKESLPGRGFTPAQAPGT